ncbi:hypothetical protein [Candidatus Kuenenia stuttgartiensis]|uniref:hypothetical protein n=1 Tax=Kuenenia stuttgartiensis TaxID=174633 RepID=UPI00146E4D1E|nr:hypothetical protein [Candidatus Kuenenia stuttgartiensis]
MNYEIERRKWALFWCNLLHPVIFGEIEKEQTNLFLKKLCLQEVVFPTESGKDPLSLPSGENSTATAKMDFNLLQERRGATVAHPEGFS